MLDQSVRDPGYGRAPDPDTEVGKAHRLSARFIEPARQQHLIGQWTSAYIAKGVEEIKQIKHSEGRNPAQADQRTACHQDARHHHATWPKAIDDPARDKSKRRPHD